MAKSNKELWLEKYPFGYYNTESDKGTGAESIETVNRDFDDYDDESDFDIDWDDYERSLDIDYDDSDEDADYEHAMLYGGDTTYCVDCGAKKVYGEDGYSYCPECRARAEEEWGRKNEDFTEDRDEDFLALDEAYLNESRECTSRVRDLIDDGALTAEQVCRACVDYMSEDDAEDIANTLLDDEIETYGSVRQYSNALIDMCEEGSLSWETLLDEYLAYMSEDDVCDMAHSNEFLDDEGEEETVDVDTAELADNFRDFLIENGYREDCVTVNNKWNGWDMVTCKDDGNGEITVEFVEDDGEFNIYISDSFLFADDYEELVDTFMSDVIPYIDYMEESLEEKAPANAIHKKSNGDYLVPCANGGYSAFNASDAHMGHISAESDDEAKTLFMGNKFDECLTEDWTVFKYASGANPYVAKTKEETQKVLNKWGDKVKSVGSHYVIDDKEEDTFSSNALTESYGESYSVYYFFNDTNAVLEKMNTLDDSDLDDEYAITHAESDPEIALVTRYDYDENNILDSSDIIYPEGVEIDESIKSPSAVNNALNKFRREAHPTSDLDTMKRNAIKAAERDGYNQLIVKDDDGSYSIVREYPDSTDNREVVGKVTVSYKDGVAQTDYKELTESILTNDGYVTPSEGAVEQFLNKYGFSDDRYQKDVYTDNASKGKEIIASFVDGINSADYRRISERAKEFFGECPVEVRLGKEHKDGDDLWATLVFDFGKCQVNEDLEGRYCIVARTLDGKFKFYKDGAFVDDYKEATIFTDMDEARSEWFDIDKSKYKRVFIPNYDESHFASLNENIGSNISLTEESSEMVDGQLVIIYSINGLTDADISAIETIGYKTTFKGDSVGVSLDGETPKVVVFGYEDADTEVCLDIGENKDLIFCGKLPKGDIDTEAVLSVLKKWMSSINNDGGSVASLNENKEDDLYDYKTRQATGDDWDPLLNQEKPRMSNAPMSLKQKASIAYKNNDDDFFYSLSDDELVSLWVGCAITDENPYGAAYDDEVYNAIYDRPNKDELFDRADREIINRMSLYNLRKVYIRYYGDSGKGMDENEMRAHVIRAIHNDKLNESVPLHFIDKSKRSAIYGEDDYGYDEYDVRDENPLPHIKMRRGNRHISLNDTSNVGEEGHPIQRGLRGRVNKFESLLTEDGEESAEGTDDTNGASGGDFEALLHKLQKMGNYEEFIQALKGLNANQKKLFMQNFGKVDAVKPQVQEGGIAATKLIPTQSEIDWKKSLSYGLKQDCSYFFSPPVELGMPVLTYAGKYIIDGHHRWSQVFMFNPKAEVKCTNFNYDQSGPLDALKDFQAAVLSQTGNVNVGTAGTNIWTVSEGELQKFIDENMADACWQSLVKAEVAEDREGAIKYIIGNAMTLKNKVKPIGNAPDRVDMPQTTPEVVARAKKGITDMSEGVTNSKQLNEGPGAGYTLSGKLKITAVESLTPVKFENADYGSYDVTFNCVALGTIEDFEFHSYMYGDSMDSAEVEISAIKTNFYAEHIDDIEALVRNNLEEVKDCLVGATVRLDYVYGAGWLHSTFDGTIAEINNLVKDSDIVYGDTFDIEVFEFAAKIKDTDVIEYVDKAVSGDNISHMYTVIDEDGNPGDAFFEEEDAIEYAKKNNCQAVDRTECKELFGGETEWLDSEIVWERDSEGDFE